jgi:hypothetical protein
MSNAKIDGSKLFIVPYFLNFKSDFNFFIDKCATQGKLPIQKNILFCVPVNLEFR